VGDLLPQARGVDGAQILGARVDGIDAKQMRSMVDDLRNRLGSSVVLLISENGGKLQLAIGVTKDVTDRWKAGDLIREVAGVVGGGGGGRPDFAQAGGKDSSKIDAAIEQFFALCGAA
jgi:alanyl-tRNA synthetase